MKNLYLRSALAVACAATLAACGGSGGNMYLGGSVVGLAKTGLVLQNGDEELTVAAGASSFVFTKLIKSEDRYNITIKTQPKGATCTMVNGSGKANSYSVSTAYVSCVTDQYTLGGTISGLSSNGLVLVNGSSGSAAPLAGSTTFTFDSTVGDGSAYNINVKTQPPGLICTISNPNGTMGSANNTSLVVACAPQNIQ